MIVDFLKDLNPAQREACEHINGPLLVLAGAGSGKTRVLTHRIAHLIRSQKVSPQSILAVTFTNKAAGEMRSRIEGIIGPLGKVVWVSTFHSACLRILRRHAQAIGYDPSFLIYDDTDQLTLIKNILKETGILNKAIKPQAIQAAINHAKNDQMTPKIFASKPLNFFEEMVSEVFYAYQEALKENNAMDFSDLINQAIRLFEECPDITKIYQNNLEYIMVDEYQDTNPAQYRWLSLLMEGRECQNLFVVGDEDQSI